MSGMTPKNVDDSKGRLKQATGDLTGDENLKREGRIDQTAGSAKDKVDEAADRAEDTADALKEKVNDLGEKLKDR